MRGGGEGGGDGLDFENNTKRFTSKLCVVSQLILQLSVGPLYRLRDQCSDHSLSPKLTYMEDKYVKKTIQNVLTEKRFILTYIADNSTRTTSCLSAN